MDVSTRRGHVSGEPAFISLEPNVCQTVGGSAPGRLGTSMFPDGPDAATTNKWRVVGLSGKAFMSN